MFSWLSWFSGSRVGTEKIEEPLKNIPDKSIDLDAMPIVELEFDDNLFVINSIDFSSKDINIDGKESESSSLIEESSCELLNEVIEITDNPVEVIVLQCPFYEPLYGYSEETSNKSRSIRFERENTAIRNFQDKVTIESETVNVVILEHTWECSIDLESESDFEETISELKTEDCISAIVQYEDKKINHKSCPKFLELEKDLIPNRAKNFKWLLNFWGGKSERFLTIFEDEFISEDFATERDFDFKELYEKFENQIIISQ